MPVSLNYSCLATETKRYLFHFLIIVSVVQFKIYLTLTFCNWWDNFSQTFNLCINFLRVIQSNLLPEIVLLYCPRIACTEEPSYRHRGESLSWSGRTPAEILWFHWPTHTHAHTLSIPFSHIYIVLMVQTWLCLQLWFQKCDISWFVLHQNDYFLSCCRIWICCRNNKSM